MLIMIDLVIGFVVGFAAHQTRPLVDAVYRKHGPWGWVINDGIGWLCGLPVGVLVNRHMNDIQENEKRYATSYLLSGVSLGTGVIAGWLVDAMLHRDE